jgi:hypothetical protein
MRVLDLVDNQVRSLRSGCSYGCLKAYKEVRTGVGPILPHTTCLCCRVPSTGRESWLPYHQAQDIESELQER